ncbi:hypothetical protein COV13_00050 [Candidatus Woesearchaeota archaeon CG10_big_fil_rev_8_21_14_0_10_32_9]|nr:MAG: hypothetical protein COV13_00050 [Candidatus Woesearchaeota archaeon CG10_big_fil_rev_8_21_14_0_10_32_9]
MTSSQTLSKLIEKGVLISPEILDKEIDELLLNSLVEEYGETLDFLDEKVLRDFEEKQKSKDEHKIKIIKSYDKPPKKRTFQDFVSVFNLRFKNITQMLKYRQDLQGITSISRLVNKNNNERVTIIGMIQDKSLTKNNSLIIKLEDLTGTITAIVKETEKNKELYQTSNDLVLDEVIGVVGVIINKALFIEKIVFPDIPLSKELKKQKEEEYVVLLGDTHFGSKHFMKEEFTKFIHWINGELGNEEQRTIAQKTKYLILTGDIVEGVGIYPGQEADLEILDIKEQYQEAANWLKKIPQTIKLVVMSGNHDAGRLSEPQERPFKDMAEAIWAMPNITIVSNPAQVNVGAKDDFPGFDFLLYHGGSLIYYSENVPSIREAGGQKRSDLIMKFLLQRRHLAPTHKSTLYLPDSEEDFLLIDAVPDFFITGHIHRSSVSSYRNVTLVNASCWTETTDDQIKRGLEPLPARIPIINLKTRDVKIMNFLTKKSKEKEEEINKEVKELKKMT